MRAPPARARPVSRAGAGRRRADRTFASGGSAGLPSAPRRASSSQTCAPDPARRRHGAVDPDRARGGGLGAAGVPCSDPTVSAMNQYCENLPSSGGGGNKPGPGTPALASHLPPAEVSVLRGTGGGADASTPGPGRPGLLPAPRFGANGTTKASATKRTRAALLTLPARAPALRSPARPSPTRAVGHFRPDSDRRPRRRSRRRGRAGDARAEAADRWDLTAANATSP